MMRLVPRSIQGRMLALSALATVTALILAGMIIAGVLARTVTQGIDRRLDAELTLLASAVKNDGSIDMARLAQLGGALEAGPGWRWQIQTPNARLGSDEMPATADGLSGRPNDPGIGHVRPLDGQDRAGVAMHARELRVSTAAGTVVLTSAAPHDVVERPVRDALVPLLMTLALLGAVLALAAVAQIRLGLRPLRQLREAVIAIRNGAMHIIDTEQPSELQPLATELNLLVEEKEATLATARASAANLAHALKTPVATLAIELHGDPRASQVDRIAETIRHHLTRARLDTVFSRKATRLDMAVAALVQAIERIHSARAIAIDLDIPPEISVLVEPADLDELVGNLVDNAVRHARSLVSVVARAQGRAVCLTVSDDGAGIPAADRTRATEPGVRLDERGDGHGFGLAIARELAALHGGTLTLGEADNGGLVAAVTLPTSSAIGS